MSPGAEARDQENGGARSAQDVPVLHSIRPDLLGTVIEGEACTIVRWAVPADRPPTPLHAHAEFEQISTVLAGAIETTVGEQTFVLGAGDVLRIRKGVLHGGTRALGGKEAVVLDMFTPPRLAYVEAARRETGADATAEPR